MQGFDHQDAHAYLLAHVDTKAYKPLLPHVPDILRIAVEADLAFMRETRVIDANGLAGDAYYDDDEAIEYIVSHVEKALKLPHRHEALLASLIDDYMDAMQAYLEAKGLLEWD